MQGVHVLKIDHDPSIEKAKFFLLKIVFKIKQYFNIWPSWNLKLSTNLCVNFVLKQFRIVTRTQSCPEGTIAYRAGVLGVEVPVLIELTNSVGDLIASCISLDVLNNGKIIAGSGGGELARLISVLGILDTDKLFGAHRKHVRGGGHFYNDNESNWFAW